MAWGNFGARPNPPKRGSNCVRTLSTAPVEDRGRRLPGAFGVAADVEHPADGVVQLVGLFEQLLAALAPRAVDGFHQTHEPGHSLPVVLREVRAAEERAPVGREEHRHRPAAATGHRLDGLHVDRVDVRPFLAVDLHVDEQPVHDRGDVGVLEGLVGHDVAPVARRVADREEDRDVPVARGGERLVTPRVPVDRIVGVLAEVGARLAGQAVGHRATVPTTRAHN